MFVLNFTIMLHHFFKPYVPLFPLYFLFVLIYSTSRIKFSYVQNLEVSSTKDSGSSTAEICTLKEK